MKRAIVYYTCNMHKPEIDEACRAQLMCAKVQAGVDKLYSVSLNKDLAFGDFALTLYGERGSRMMHEQIMMGLSCVPSANWIVFLCENDVLYHVSHFDFIPPRRDTFYYNTNVWRVRDPDGHAVWTDGLQQVSGLCAHRDLLLGFYTQRLAQIEQGDFNRHYEPGLKQTVGGMRVENRQAEYPNLDIRHDGTFTRSKWSPTEFRNPRYARGWKETDAEIPGWGQTAGRLAEFLKNLTKENKWAVPV